MIHSTKKRNTYSKSGMTDFDIKTYQFSQSLTSCSTTEEEGIFTHIQRKTGSFVQDNKRILFYHWLWFPEGIIEYTYARTDQEEDEWLSYKRQKPFLHFFRPSLASCLPKLKREAKRETSEIHVSGCCCSVSERRSPSDVRN